MDARCTCACDLPLEQQQKGSLHLGRRTPSHPLDPAPSKKHVYTFILGSQLKKTADLFTEKICILGRKFKCKVYVLNCKPKQLLQACTTAILSLLMAGIGLPGTETWKLGKRPIPEYEYAITEKQLKKAACHLAGGEVLNSMTTGQERVPYGYTTCSLRHRVRMGGGLSMAMANSTPFPPPSDRQLFSDSFFNLHI